MPDIEPRSVAGLDSQLATTRWTLMIGVTPPNMDFSTLCSTIEHRLCDLGQLVPNQFPMTQREVIRGGQSVGLYFCVHGPRSVKLTAIWDFVKRTVVFYGADGLRRDSLPIAVRGPLTAAA